MIISGDTLPEDIMFELLIDLPAPLLFLSDHLNIDARVAWRRIDIGPPFHHAGLEFLNPSEQDRRIITKLIDSYELRPISPDHPQTAAPL